MGRTCTVRCLQATGWRAEGTACTFAATWPRGNRIIRCSTLLPHMIFIYFLDEVGSLWGLSIKRTWNDSIWKNMTDRRSAVRRSTCDHTLAEHEPVVCHSFASVLKWVRLNILQLHHWRSIWKSFHFSLQYQSRIQNTPKIMSQMFNSGWEGGWTTITAEL